MNRYPQQKQKNQKHNPTYPLLPTTTTSKNAKSKSLPIAPFHAGNSASLNKWVTCDKRAYQNFEEGISKFSNTFKEALLPA
jgi:hypothetical protein